jgi:hypothetical protein
VFVFGNKTIDNAEKIKILKKHKKLILQELSAIFSIDEKSLFQDIYGFSMLFKTKTPPSLSLLESQANHKATKKSRLKSTSPVAAP